MKKVLSIIIATLMLLTFIPFAYATDVNPTSRGDIIEYGSYPQSEVTDETLLEELNALEFDWVSYGYYYGDGTTGSMVQSDEIMSYADVTLRSEKYRAVRIDNYRRATLLPIENFQPEEEAEIMYKKGNVYWFKYEPVKWVVIDPCTGLAASLLSIDFQPYCNTLYIVEVENADGTIQEYLSSDPVEIHDIGEYKYSSIREWLNNTFADTAFSADEKAGLINTTGGSTESDKVFLLSEEEALKYSEEKWVASAPTDYACSQSSAYKIPKKDSARWYFRCDEETSLVSVMADGKPNFGAGVWFCGYGTKPAIQLKSIAGHNEITVEEKGDCVTPGHINTICSGCGKVYNSKTTGFGDHANIETRTIDGTCLEKGAIVNYCTTCNTEISREETDFAEHKGYIGDGICDICGNIVEVDEALYHGQCGDNAFWKYDTDTATLTVFGTGDTWDSYCNERGWEIFKNEIKHIVVKDGITSISRLLFAYMFNVETVSIGNTVNSIGKGAFVNLISLDSVEIPSNVKIIDDYAFMSCKLKSITFNEGLEKIGDVAFAYDLLNHITIPSTVKEIAPYAFSTFAIDSITNYSETAVCPLSSMGWVENPYDEILFMLRKTLAFMEDVEDFNSPEFVKLVEEVNEKFGMNFKDVLELIEVVQSKWITNEDEDGNPVSYIPDYYFVNCLPNSARHEYCKENNVPHYFTDFTCDFECGIHASVSEYHYFAPTCTENGFEGGKVCTVCLANATTPEEEEAAILEASTVIPAKGHTTTVLPQVNPTCTSTGLTEGSFCESCGEIFIAREEIPALEHVDLNGDGICDNCGRDTDNTDVEHPQTFFERVAGMLRTFFDRILQLFKRLFG